MSIYKKRILAFIRVIETQSNIISHSDWVELQEITKDLSDDDEEIYRRIKDWLQPEHRSDILQAYNEQLAQLKKLDNSNSIDIEKDLGGGGAKSTTDPNNSSPPTKELLDNTIHKHSPLSDNPPFNQ